MSKLLSVDPQIAALITAEANRQEIEIDLIASENYASQAVMEASGSVLTNKYAEGYPNKRYYAGCEIVDKVENLAIERCKELFGAEHVNVQPHAGSQANMAAFYAVLKPGDTILGMSLAEGGHLTHGHSVNFSGQFYKSVQYTVNPETELIDYDQVERLAQEHKPKLIIAGASAYSRFIDFERFARIAQSVGAYFMADIAHIAGLIAAKVHPSPVGSADIITSTTHKTLRGPRGGLIMSKQNLASAIDRAIMPGTQGGPCLNIIAAKAVAFHEALSPDFIDYQKQILANAQAMAQAFQSLDYRIVSGGTDNHLFVIDLRTKHMNGKIAQDILTQCGIVISRSCVPFDTEKPWITSGIRIGTPAITTRGMKEQEALQIVQMIDQALKNQNNEPILKTIHQKITALCQKFPVYHQ
jgi:glycine hydroxymethyltransferase